MLKSPLKIALCLSLPFITLTLYLALFSSVPQALFAQSLSHPLTQNLIKSVVDPKKTSSTTVFMPIVSGASSVQSPSVEVAELPPNIDPWLTLINYYRATANLPTVQMDDGWSEGTQLHARYMVKNDILTHSEDLTNAWYTPDGYAAGPKSNIMGSFVYAESDEFFINSWMQAPFHALGILSPHLEQVGYGHYTEERENGLKTAAALNVIDGMVRNSDPDIYPVMWPADGATVPLRQHTSEYPALPPSCPGYRIPLGLPIILQIGNGNNVPDVTAHSLMADDTEIESCVIDEMTYTNPDPSAQALGRSILNARDAVILIPRLPLVSDVTYTASITVDEEVYTWSFESSGG